MIELCESPIDVAAVLAAAQSPQAGAVVLFLGTTRQFTDGKETAELKYEAYAKMAMGELQRLAEEARTRWSLVGCAAVHRLGVVPVGEASVAIATSSPHRADAFAAGQWLIDTLKDQAPIWKQECWTDGSREWIHPGAPAESSP